MIDLLVLFILHSTNANQSRRGAEKLLKVKVRSGLIQEALLQRTFRDFAQVGHAAGVHTSISKQCVVEQCSHSSLFQQRDVMMINGDPPGHARIFLLHPGSGSVPAALP